MLDSPLALTLAIDWPAVFTGLLVVAFLFVCVVLILTVLIQRPQGGGLSGAFGSAAGSSQTAFGAKTGDVLTIFTIGVFLLFLFVAVGLNWRISAPAPTAPVLAPLDDDGGAPADGQQQAPGQGLPADSAAPGELDPIEIPPEFAQPAPPAEQEQQPTPAEGQKPPAAEGQEPQAEREDPPAEGAEPPANEPPADPAPQGEEPPTSPGGPSSDG